MNVLDLFSGIGGFSLGLERAGMRTVAFCEIDPYCRAVLRRHWPSVHIFDDIRTLTGPLARYWGSNVIDVICGGFPCQDISTAGKGAGIEGERSGLWSEYARLIGEIRPQYVIVENVAALLGRGLDRVLGDLAALGFDAEWHCISASAVGAPHRRDRVWIIADSKRPEWRPLDSSCAADRQQLLSQRQEGAVRIGGSGAHVAHADEPGLAQRVVFGGIRGQEERGDARQNVGLDGEYAAHYSSIGKGIRRGDAAGQWWVEPDVGRVAHGVPSRVDRLRSLGNAVVPQIPEIIGRAIMKAANGMPSESSAGSSVSADSLCVQK